ncbi:MAG: carotenoid 1,2-hydratase [Burkholderiales bacterium]|nr:carotenoid 1,2-hydratase [Burkholderiales bacterium]
MTSRRNCCRRAVSSLAAVALAATSPAIAETEYPVVLPGVEVVFPRDHGAHPAYRTEWWYITGWVRDRAGRDLGIQVTFFRNRPGVAEDNPSAFAPRQLLFAHAALADAAHGRLRHDQRAARAGFGFARAAEDATDVHIGDWSLRATTQGYAARIAAGEFTLDLAFRVTQPVLLQGAGGYSRKGPLPGQSSFYYSRPHLAVSGMVVVDGVRLEIAGEAWLDHEWSSEYLAPEAQGWDWTGVNLADGGALMAFRIRDRHGGTFWAGGTLRRSDGTVRRFAPGEIAFTPLRTWRSPRTEAEYPVAMRVRAGTLELELAPMMDDQELDSRASVGTVYWEGAVRALEGEREIGRGYLELTGYWRPLRL